MKLCGFVGNTDNNGINFQLQRAAVGTIFLLWGGNFTRTYTTRYWHLRKQKFIWEGRLSKIVQEDIFVALSQETATYI